MTIDMHTVQWWAKVEGCRRDMDYLNRAVGMNAAGGEGEEQKSVQKCF